MAYYVRKIARAKWALLEHGAENVIENYKADTIANDMKTQGNTLSLWRVESMDKKDIDPVIVINSLLGDTISKIDLIFIPEDMITDFTLKQKDGNTVVSKYCNLHYDVVSLTVKKHILFAKDVVLKIFALEEARSKNGTQDGQSSLIKRYNEITLWDKLYHLDALKKNGDEKFMRQVHKLGFEEADISFDQSRIFMIGSQISQNKKEDYRASSKAQHYFSATLH